MRVVLVICACVALVANGQLEAGPVENRLPTIAEATNEKGNITQPEVTPAPTVIATTTPAEVNRTTAEAASQDLETAGTENEVSDNQPSASGLDPTYNYPGLLSPEQFQQYVNQLGAAAAYAPYAAAAYPPPLGYAPPPPPPFYPSPYVVQTGYEGYLVPSTTTTTAATTTTTTEASTNSNGLLNPLSSLITALMNSPIFRVIAGIVSAIGMMFFGNFIMNAICNLTPLCELGFKTVTYLRRSGTAENVGSMIAQEMTPERVRRATEFVRNAIRKYRQLQYLLDEQQQSDADE